jgi:subtilisin family serine protease
VVAAVAVGLWVVGVNLFAHPVGWLAGQVQLVSGLAQPTWLRLLPSLLAALLTAVPAVLLAALTRSAPVRAAGRAWAYAAGTLALLGLLRAVPPPLEEYYLAGLALVTTVTAGVARLLRRRGGGARRPPVPRVAVGFAVAAGLAALLPWVWLGALGGLLGTALAAVAAAGVGWLAGTLLGGTFWAAYEFRTDGRPRHAAHLVLVGGLVAGVALLPLAAGTGQDGAQLAALVVLPALGFVTAALRPLSRPPSAEPGAPPVGGSAPVGWLVGLAAFGPLAFVDPEEVTLLLADGRDVPYWVAVATGAALLVAWLLGAGYAVGLARAARPRAVVAVGAAVVLLLATVGVYLGPGQPGLYGEKLFVVLKEQADLSGVPAGTGFAGREARGREVYRRLVDTARRSQAGLLRELDRLHLAHRSYYLVNAVEVDAGPTLRPWLAGRGEVDRVLLSPRLRPLPAEPVAERGTAAPPTGPLWNITMIGADRVRSELRVDPSTVTVGSSDSGVDGTHPALSAGFRGGDDSWYDPWNGTRSPVDHGGHGTHTLATAVGTTGVGVAPGARWVGCVNLDRNLGSPARYLDCLQFMMAPFPAGGDPFAGRPERAPQVLTNSWGCPELEGCDRGALRPATAALAAAGIFVAASAGNTGPYCGSVADPPALYPDVFTVGAVDGRKRVTDFSSRGPVPGAAKPDVVAPGAQIVSAVPGGGYAAKDGTSMAGPHVAGVVALMWAANPALVGDLDRTARILRDTATPAAVGPPSQQAGGTCGGRDATGAGLVDADAAVRAAK